MAKLTDYIESSHFDSGDILIKDGLSGTRKIKVANAAVEFAQLSPVATTSANGLMSKEDKLKLDNLVAGNSIFIASKDASPELKARANFVCDGEDDEVELLAAIESLNNGGSILMSEGEFIFNNNINTQIAGINKNNITIKGFGKSTSIRSTGNLNSGQHVILLEGVSGWELADFAINGQDIIKNIDVFGILVCRASNIIINNLHIHNMPCSAIYLMTETTDSIVSNCDIHDNQNSGITCSADNGNIKNIIITGNTVKRCNLTTTENGDIMGIQLEGQFGKTISNVIVVNNILLENSNGIWASLLKDSIITGNVIADNTREGGVIFESERVNINNNVITGNALNFEPGYRNGFRISDSGLSDSCKNISFTNNIFDIHVERHLAIRGNADRINISGNTFIGTPWVQMGITTNVNAPEIRINNNMGFVSKNNGTATIASGSNYVDVIHALSKHDGGIPGIERIKITPINSLGNATKYWVSDVGETTFRINTDIDPGTSGAEFSWEASCKYSD